MLLVLEVRTPAEHGVSIRPAVEGVEDDEMADALRVQGRVEAEPVSSGRPPEEVDLLRAGASDDPRDDGIDVADGLDRTDERRIRLRRLRHFGRARRAPVAAEVHDEGRVSRLREVGRERASGRGQIERGDAGDARAVEEEDRILRRRTGRSNLAHEESDARLSVDEVVRAEEGGREQDRKCHHRQLTPVRPEGADSRVSEGDG